MAGRRAGGLRGSGVLASWRQLRWYVKRNEMTREHGTEQRERERERSCAFGHCWPAAVRRRGARRRRRRRKKKFPSPAARAHRPPPPFSFCFRPPSGPSVRRSVRPSLVPRRRRHRKRRRSRLICPNGLCLRQREQDHKNSETARGRERASGSHSQT